MRGVSKRVRRAGGLLALSVVLSAPAVFADNPSPLPEPPGARIGNPGGAPVQSQEEPSLFDQIMAWLAARIGNPGG